MTTTANSPIRKSTEMHDSEMQQKFVEERVAHTEQSLGALCAEFVGYTRRTSKIRNNGDEISQILLRYSDNEQLNGSSRVALKHVAEEMAKAEDHRSSLTDRLAAKVVNPLAQFGVEFKNIKSNLKTAFNARKREDTKVKSLEKLTSSNPNDVAKLTKARSDLERASLEATKTSSDLEQEIVSFEKKKIHSLKYVMKDFIQMELMWHARALECYSKAFTELEKMDEEEDLEEFRASLRPDSLPVGRLLRHKSASQTSLASNHSNGSGRGRPPLPNTRSTENMSRNNNAVVSTSKTNTASASAKKQVVVDNEEDYSDEEEYSDEMSEEESETDFDTTTGRTTDRSAPVPKRR